MVEVSLTDEFDLDLAAIKAKLSPKTKAIVLNSPHNPTGSVYSQAAPRSLAATLQGSGINVSADDFYAKLVYDTSFTLTACSADFERLMFAGSQATLTGALGLIKIFVNQADRT